MDKYLKEGKNLVKTSLKKSPDAGSSPATTTPPLSPTQERINGNLSRKDAKKVTKRRTLVHPVFYIKFFKGFITFFKGFYLSINTKEIRKTYFETLKIMLIMMASVYLALTLLSFPVMALMGLFTKLGLGHFETIQIHFTPLNLLSKIAFFIPMVFIGVLRYVLPSYNEDMFFNVMASQNKQLAEFLKESPVVKQYPFSGYMIRFGKMALFGGVVYLFSMVPYIGTFVLAASNFYYAYQPLGMGMSFILSVISLHPSLKSHSAYMLKALMASYSLGKELLEVYYCRVPDAKQEIYINRRFFGWLFGFSIISMYVLSIPYVGISLWGVIQGSASFLVIRILERNKFKEDVQHDTSIIHLFGEQCVTAAEHHKVF
ncbi:hypothetical protein DFA_05897 [Cavenderia fasciculata]|uniref:Transmembrane protein n=1 Tax=Cavenderia fasciculata TaxID=261658 RepID=F4PJI8_CACFS|nr:uncharacterized protein DFA_05897 [Cavenderia fasciculata]EGG23762.1 hypothetical protein DFA_05897 [Cavenderia fasciculata]|eukprot:XP_004361613.1 hypothetical protein DFA_05897 [Cavenderia fasciculata]